MDALREAVTSFAGWVAVIAAVIVILTRCFKNTKRYWAVVGALLLIVAIGNATILASYTHDGSAQLISLLGVVVYGGLGVAFLANWLLDGAV